MHELSLADGILQVVEDAAAREAFARVLQLRLEVGKLAGVELQALRFALEAIAPGTLLDTMSTQVQTRADLIEQTKQQEQQLFTLRSRLLKMDQLEHENQRLRELLGSDLPAAQRRVGDLEGELMRARGQLARAWPAQRRVLLAVSAGLRAVAPLLGEGEEARAHGAQPEHVPERAEAVRGLGEAARALLALGVGDSGARGRLYRELRHPALVYQVAFEPGGRWLYTMCEDGKVRRFSVPGGRELSGFLGDASPVPFVAAVAPGGRDGGASAGRASSAGRYLLTRQGGPFGGDSRRLWLWDLQREGVAALSEPGAAASGGGSSSSSRASEPRLGALMAQTPPAPPHLPRSQCPGAAPAAAAGPRSPARTAARAPPARAGSARPAPEPAGAAPARRSAPPG